MRTTTDALKPGEQFCWAEGPSNHVYTVVELDLDNQDEDINTGYVSQFEPLFLPIIQGRGQTCLKVVQP